VISTIGCPFLLDSLATLRHPPDDVIVVLDVIGRRSSTLDRDYPLPQLSADLEKLYPSVRLLFNNPTGPWAVMNQCYNIGWRAARHPFVWFTHDDIEYPDFDFPTFLGPVLRVVERERVIGGKRIVGLVLPEYEVANRVSVPSHPRGATGLTQFVSPVSQIVAVDTMHELGGFDETDGIWYDGQLEVESSLRGWWYLLMDTPELRHMSNRTYLANNWGDRWAANPVWGEYSRNFRRRYGTDWQRDLNAPLLPLSEDLC
jgi:hypothetical protein